MGENEGKSLLSLVKDTFAKTYPLSKEFSSYEEAKETLQQLILCPQCVEAYFLCENHEGGQCWNCNSEIQLVDDYNARSMNGEEPIFLIGTDGDGWAFAEWCNLIDEGFDHYDYWHC
jgi:hypothetical protein